MIVTDYNKMTIEEILVINRVFRKEYVIEGGKITEVVDGNEEKNRG